SPWAPRPARDSARRVTRRGLLTPAPARPLRPSLRGRAATGAAELITLQHSHMPSFAFALQGTSPTTIGETDVIRFAGGAFATKIAPGAWNDSTHVRNSGGSETS